ncbi:hypothetical protein AVEN_36297-1 [Araneus ventricosus]|uniref:EGF-like domain-containing protein n=1 Tax=Araneus ventricosus TaxID=182803 RepID=A0A4Y2NYA2_ARAVE|nr:hypothetical protein AVEN_36297-1 [Araneus ventricosus]
MNALKIFAVCLLLAFGVVSQSPGTSTVQSTEDHETQTTSSESLSTETVDNNLETTEKPEKTNQTDVDTDGDVIITRHPEDETENDHNSSSTSTLVERNATEVTTEVPSTTLSETTTLQINWRACSSNPCKNGGLCMEDHSDPKLYTCKCSHGYSGTHCQVADSCFVDEDGNICNEGTCVYAKDALSRSCACFFGMFWDEDMQKCRKAEPPCFPNPCHNGTCIQDGGDFQCSCRRGYEGNTCEIRNLCGEEDYCENGECKENSEKVKYCECHSDFYWNEEKRKCEAGVVCAFPDLNACDQICIPEEEGYTCKCEEVFLLNDDNRTCEYIGNSTNCTNKTCNNGICVRIKEGEKCICGPGFEEVEDNCVDLCTAEKLPEGYCPDNKCEATDSGFKCKCEGKYTYSDDDITCKASCKEKGAWWARSRLQDKRISDSKPGNTEDPPCMWICSSLNLTSRVKCPPAGVE